MPTFYFMHSMVDAKGGRAYVIDGKGGDRSLKVGEGGREC